MVEESAANVSDVERKIIQQIEYYFGDVNLPKDRLLTQEASKDDGWVSIQTLLTFNRLKALSTDVAFIAVAVKKSTNQLVEVSDSNSKIRRSKNKPLPENRLEFWKQLKTRTVYVKGFPADIKMDQLMDFFSQYGKVETLLMRRTKDAQHIFKGSVFATFASRDFCQEFLNRESVKYNDVELMKMFESDYYAKKSEERKQNKMQKQKGNVAARAQQKSAEGDEKATEHIPKYTTGLVIHLTNFPEANKIDRDAIKKVFQQFGEVDWIDFNRGEKEAFVRLKGVENAAEPILNKVKEANDGKVIVCEQDECQASVLSGDDESNYWRKTVQARKQALDRKSKNKKNRPRNKTDFKQGGDRRRGNDKTKTVNKADSVKTDAGIKRAHEDADKAEQVASKVAKTE